MLKLWRSLGKYQRRLCILLLLSAATNPFGMLSLLFLQYTPDYHCQISGIEKNVTSMILSDFNRTYNASEKADLYNFLIPTEISLLGEVTSSRCTMYNRTQKELREFAQGVITRLRNDFAEIVACTSIEFNYEEGASSAIDQFDMVCENSWKKPMVGINYMIGNLVGSIISGWLSDQYGRKFSFLAFTGFQFLASFTSSFSTSFEMYAALVFCMGFGSTGSYMGAIMLGSESVGKQYRNLLCSLTSIGYALGYMALPLMASCLQDWRWYAFATGVFGVVYIPYYWLVDESPRWLIAVGKTKKAEKILQKIAKYNGQDTEVKIDEDDSEEKAKKRTTIRTWVKFLKSPTLVFRLVLTFSTWIICNMAHYANVFDTNSLSGSRFLNCFYTGVAELVGYCVSYATVELGGRRKSYIGFMLAAGISILITPFVKIWSPTAETILAMFSNLCVSIGYYVVYICTPELYPTVVRHTTMSLASAFGRVGGILAPSIIFAGQGGTSYIPYLASGILTIVISSLFIFTPNTHNVRLPESVEEAVNMEDRNCCCLGRNTKSSSFTEQHDFQLVLLEEDQQDA